MTCIICHDSGVEPLHNNKFCACKYEKHVSCWIDYVHSKTILTCPVCRKDLSTIKSINNSSTRALPYRTRMETIPEEQRYIFTYQEMPDFVSDNILTRNRTHIRQTEPYSSSITCEKITKTILTLTIVLIAIVVAIIIF